MKKFGKRLVRILLVSFSAIAAVLMFTGVWFAARGYMMYRDAADRLPMDEMVSSVRAQEGFTKYDDLPQIYIDAVVSAEDKRFFDHCGVDPLAVCRALWIDVKTLSFAEGGSTITQQLMKNQYFTQEKTLERKCAEVFAALAMERRYGKEDIFELYVNTIYFGNGYYGISAAAQGYFGKSPGELTDYEAVMLAGLPNAPSAYSPDESPELAAKRTKQVLDRMVDCGVLSRDEADRILASG